MILIVENLVRNFTRNADVKICKIAYDKVDEVKVNDDKNIEDQKKVTKNFVNNWVDNIITVKARLVARNVPINTNENREKAVFL